MIKLKDILNESVVAKDGKVLSNGNLIGYYEFDRDSDSFWVNDVKKGKGQLSFETKREVEDYFKKNERDAVKHLSKLRGESVNEATTSWSRMMGDVKKGGSGPWSLVGIENNKVVAQKINIKDKNLLPAHFEAMRRENPKAKIHIEDGGGQVVWNEKK